MDNSQYENDKSKQSDFDQWEAQKFFNDTVVAAINKNHALIIELIKLVGSRKGAN